MKKKPCPLYTFLEAVRGNWRNAVYVECGNVTCQRGKTCTGFLLAFDPDGHPAIMPVDSLRSLSGRVIDVTECLTTMERNTFETLFSRWLAWETSQDGECILGRTGYLPKCAGIK